MEDHTQPAAASSPVDQNRSQTDHSDQTSSVSDHSDQNSDHTDHITDQPSSNAEHSDQTADQNRSKAEKLDFLTITRQFAAGASSKKNRNSTDRTYTFRADDDIDEILLGIQDEYGVGKGEAVKLLIKGLREAVNYATVELEAVLSQPKSKVEVIKEVPRPLLSGEHIVKLTDQQQQIVKIIASRRNELAKSRGQELEESVGDILVKALFIKGRLFNYDNEFYTGLSKNDAQ